VVKNAKAYSRKGKARKLGEADEDA
jgi:hypothetical protein